MPTKVDMVCNYSVSWLVDRKSYFLIFVLTVLGKNMVIFLLFLFARLCLFAAFCC